MIVQVGLGRMNLAERQMRQALDNFFRRAAVDFSLRKNVLNAHPRAGDERPRLTVAIGTDFNMCGRCLNHKTTILPLVREMQIVREKQIGGQRTRDRTF